MICIRMYPCIANEGLPTRNTTMQQLKVRFASSIPLSTAIAMFESNRKSDNSFGPVATTATVHGGQRERSVTQMSRNMVAARAFGRGSECMMNCD